MSSSALTSGNSAIVMIDHAAGFGNSRPVTTRQHPPDSSGRRAAHDSGRGRAGDMAFHGLAVSGGAIPTTRRFRDSRA